MIKDSVGQELRGHSRDTLFLFLQLQLGRLKWLGVTPIPEHWSYMEASSLRCWALGLKWFQEYGKLGLLTGHLHVISTCGLGFPNYVFPETMAYEKASEEWLFQENQRKQNGLFWLMFRNHIVSLLLNFILKLIYYKLLRLPRILFFSIAHLYIIT